MHIRTGIPSSHFHRLIIPDDVLIQFDLLMMSTVMLETCRDMKQINTWTSDQGGCFQELETLILKYINYNHANVRVNKLKTPCCSFHNTSSIFCLLLTKFGRVRARQNFCTCYLSSSRLQIVPICSGTPPPLSATCSVDSGVVSRGLKRPGSFADHSPIHLHLAPRLRKSGVTPLLPPPCPRYEDRGNSTFCWNH
jgi:hypothetical protein